MTVSDFARPILGAVALIAVLTGPALPVEAGELRIAVAANFAVPAQALAAAFEAETGTQVSVSTGSSGALFAQITQGAPFALFLSADAARPKALEEAGLAISGSRFTYALGKLALWSKEADVVDANGAVLKTGTYTHLSIANPETAPYGTAAIETLEALGVLPEVEARLVIGQSVAQAFQFVQSGNAELGFVALSQLGGAAGGSHWLVPAALYRPIRQDAVLLVSNNPDADAFIAYLKQTEAREIIAGFGYDLDDMNR